MWNAKEEGEELMIEMRGVEKQDSRSSFFPTFA
jgi:hypothetical protein